MAWQILHTTNRFGGRIPVERVVYQIVDEDQAVPTDPQHQQHLADYYKGLGSRIRQAREQAGYTQTRLAEAVGLSPAAVNNYEAGIRQVPVHILLDFARMLGKPLHYFFGPQTEPALLIQGALKSAVERFTDAVYIQDFVEIVDGDLTHIGSPQPLLPVPAEIAAGHSFALKRPNPDTGTSDYYLCKWHKPRIRATGFFLFRRPVAEYVSPDEHAWVLALHGDTHKVELVQFKDVTPTQRDVAPDDPQEIQVLAEVIARLERMVKPE